MNVRFILSQLGSLLIVLSAVMLLAAGGELAIRWSYGGLGAGGARPLLETALLGLALGGLARLIGGPTRAGPLYRRETLLLVAVGWLAGSALAALPYLLWAHFSVEAPAGHPFRGYINCFFEAVSGLTTCGATVLSDIEVLPHGLLLWRAMTHFIGGIGIVVLFVAVLPALGVSAKRLFSLESTVPSPEEMRPRIREAAAALLLIYCGLNAAETVALRLCGLSWFEAFSHASATIATGGFSPRTASLGAYRSTAVNAVVMVFMVLSGVNFGLYYRLIRERGGGVWRDSELRVYLVLVLVATAVVVGALLISPQPLTTTGGETIPPTAGRLIEHGAFNALSVQTTTGFATADFDRWPFLTQAVFIASMFIGGCAGSTTGGIKVIRLWVFLKVLAGGLEKTFRPEVVRTTRLAGGVVDSDLKLAAVSYVVGVGVLLGVGSVVMMLLEGGRSDYTTAFTACLASFCTTGPGLHGVGPVENYGGLTAGSKGLLCAIMFLGRLEVFPLAVLLLPGFWRRP